MNSGFFFFLLDWNLFMIWDFTLEDVMEQVLMLAHVLVEVELEWILWIILSLIEVVKISTRPRLGPYPGIAGQVIPGSVYEAGSVLGITW